MPPARLLRSLAKDTVTLGSLAPPPPIRKWIEKLMLAVLSVHLGVLDSCPPPLLKAGYANGYNKVTNKYVLNIYFLEFDVLSLAYRLYCHAESNNTQWRI